MSVNIVDKSTGNLIKIAGNPIEQASGISYDHTSSGMQANNVQAAVDELKSGLTNVADDVKLNTNDLTTPSRSKNAINILDKASETINGVTAVCSGGVITVTGESSGDAEFYFSLGTPLVLDPALYKIAFNNTATNQYMAIRFRNSSTTLLNWAPNVENRIVENWQDSVTCDRISIAIPNGYFTEMSISITVLDKTETDPTFAPYIPSVESRIEAVESGVAGLTTTFKVEGSATDLSLWANDNGVVVLSTYIAAIDKRVGFKRAADGTISSYESD